MIFSKRQELAEAFEYWRHNTKSSDGASASASPINVITWLQIVGLLRTTSAEKFLRKNKEK